MKNIGDTVMIQIEHDYFKGTIVGTKKKWLSSAYLIDVPVYGIVFREDCDIWDVVMKASVVTV